MHLKSLTLRGFKSFASSTTLHFEPGITAVVGPNGSGKSNVVDAIAWVLGEQGAKSLRGGKMEDVIFAGTSARPPLGRAEVTLTIDNSDGALPLDYTEISLSRLMFRTGESEYSINGTPCRLLDVQELLSDSGIGREMHVVVGQGQLDSILTGRPEDRRAFIEEAAGVLKHRKRKEKALRKLEAMQANLTRLTDLTGELRRQLGPLGRQAEVARRAAVVQAELRDARLRLLADDLTALTETLRREVADEEEIRTRRQAVEAQLAEASAAESRLEGELAELTPALARAQETWYRLAALADRLRATGSLAAERGRHLAAAEQAARTGPDPAALEAAARETREEERGLQGRIEELRAALAERSAARAAAEAALAEEEARILAAARAAADRREGLARLTGQVGALRSRRAAAEEEIGRLAAAAADAVARAEAAQAEYRALESEIAGLDRGEEGLDARHETAVSAFEAASARLAELQQEERELERERSALQARCDALALSLQRRDAAAALLSAPDRPHELKGALAELLGVEPGYEAAVAAALGPAADSVAVTGAAPAVSLLERARSEDAGRITVIVAGEVRAEPPAGPAPAGGRWAVEVVRPPHGFEAAVSRLLAGVLVVADLDAARRAVEADPELVAVTRDGDLLAAGWAAGGSGGAPSRLEVQAALEETQTALAEITHRAERLRFAVGSAAAERELREAEVGGTLAELHDSDARLAAVAEKLAQLGGAARAAQAEAERLHRTRAEAETNRDRWTGELAELEERLQAAQDAPAEGGPTEDHRQEAAAAAAAARSAEVDARLALRTAEERAQALAERAESYESAAQAERSARTAAASAAARREREAVVAAAVSRASAVAVVAVQRSLAAAAEGRSATEATRTVREGELLAVRGRLRELGATLETLTDAVHRDEVLRAEQRARIEGLAAKAVEEYGVDEATLLAEYGPDVPVPVVPEPGMEDAEPPPPVPYRREQQEQRARTAERSLALLGKVNPLALEEFAALQERQRYLAEQLEDLKATRRDLLTVVKEVDERVQALFAAAFEDTAREFEQVFATLFPGGEGRLVLTEPDDLLASGVEVEARPAGKRVKRLSLLSGGERSLTAIALLVAIFRARPSPFYVLDEVEAALDERNLDRLIRLLEELRGTSQLIVITHQKRTMEAADSLYGVTMRGDGITEVISQRIREPEPA